MVNIFIIDDHILIIKGLKNIFRSANDQIRIVGSSTDLETAVESLKKCCVNIILLDLYLGVSDPLSNINLLKTNFPEIPIIILSSETSARWKCKAIQAGAHGFVSKSEDINTLKETILLVDKGKSVIPDGLSAYSKPPNMTSGVDLKKSDNHSLIFDLANGMSVKEVANKHNRTISAIEKRLTDVRKEYNAKTNAELVRIFFQHREI